MLNLVANGPSGYNLTNSLRFRSSASAYLNRTPPSTGNNITWTYSGWVKRGKLGSSQDIFGAGNLSTIGNFINFTTSDTVDIYYYNSAYVWRFVTTQVFRDPSAWYHIVVAYDATQATNTNRLKLYVNGVQVTAFSTATYPALNQTVPINSGATVHYISDTASYFDGYMAEVNFIDGQALTPSSFGSTNSTTGVWQPAKYTGTYGTNGFYLNFSNIALTSGSNTGLGKDYSGNGNYWNTNNISVTAGTTYDAMTDVPTLTSATVANYPVLNPISPASISATISEANLKATGISTSAFESAISTMSFTSGKIYFECTCLSGVGTSASGFIGITNISNATSGSCFTNSGSGSIGWDINGTTLYTIINTTTTSRGIATPTNKVFRVAYDSSTGNIWLGYDTTWIGGGDPSTLTTPTGTLPTGVEYIAGATLNTTNDSVAINFGQRPFAQTIPTGFVALNTYNLPTSTIVQGNKYMDATTYTGTGANATITNAGSFQPDLVWVKVRSTTGTHVLTDSNRGANKQLFSNLTNAEATATNKITGFTSTGFTLGADNGTGTGDANFNGSTYVGWQWQAGQGSTSSNTSGSITSTVSVNASAGFSIVTYTGTGANATVGHGLGVAPKMVIVKKRSATGNWIVWHGSLGGTQYLVMNLTNAVATDARVFTTSPSSTVFSVGTDTDVNGSSATEVAYCWAEIAGFSKFTSYTGNGSSDGVFVYLGFRPKFVMVKRTDTTNNWQILNTSQQPYNEVQTYMLADLSNAETTANNIDFLSNGFKLRSANAWGNASGGTYIVAAWAENPFKNSLAR